MKPKPAEVTELTTESIDARLLLKVLSDFKRGDFASRLPPEQTGLTGKIYDLFNEVIELNERMAEEFERVATVVGKEGRLKQRAVLPMATGSWAASIDSVNSLIGDLAHPTTKVQRVIGAVARGDFSQTAVLEVEGRPLAGELLRTARLVNATTDQLSNLASEITRVARDAGTEGRFAGPAPIKGIAGAWKDLADSVNGMATNLGTQMREIADVTSAVAK